MTELPSETEVYLFNMAARAGQEVKATCVLENPDECGIVSVTIEPDSRGDIQTIRRVGDVPLSAWVECSLVDDCKISKACLIEALRVGKEYASIRRVADSSN